MAVLGTAEGSFRLSYRGTMVVQARQDGCEEMAVDKHNPEKCNASSCSGGRIRDRAKMWAAMGEDVEIHLKL